MLPRVVATLAEGLAVPWGIDFLPDGSAVVTERDSTRVLRVDADGAVEEIGTIDAAAPEGEGGLLGVAVSPSYATDGLLFFYLTTAEDNRVVRATYDPAAGLGATEVVLDGIPNGFIHDGGRLAFGPDGYLYVSTGETGESARWPRTATPSAARSCGSPPTATRRRGTPTRARRCGPGGTATSRAWPSTTTDRLWASEFGDSTWDELNLIEKGHNYGWPEVEGEGDRDGFTDPQVRVVDRRGLPLRPRLPRRARVDGRAARRSGSGASTSRAARPPTRRTSSSASTAGCAPSSSPPTGGSGSPRPTGTAAASRPPPTTGSWSSTVVRR